MNITTPVFWEQGLFLQPQHFQVAQMYHQQVVDSSRVFHGPYPWGVGKMDVDTEAIAARVFSLNSGVFLFRDGTQVSLPGNAVVEKRSFDGQWPSEQETMKVYLGVRRWDSAGGNVTEVDGQVDPAKISTRFACPLQTESVPDLYSQGPAAVVKRLDVVVRVFWEHERDNAGDYELLPVAQIRRVAESFELMRNYIPPCYSHRASENLSVLLEELSSMIASRCRQLEELKRRPGYQSSKLGSEDFMEFFGLNVLSDFVPALRYIYESPRTHPWEFYGMLYRCVGKLSIFSTEMGADCHDYNGERVVPPYDHLDIYGCFVQMRSLLSTLLNQMSLGVENSIPLTPTAPSIFSGRLTESMRNPRSQFFLVARTRSEDKQKICNELLTIAKLSSAENIRAIASRFVGGVSLQHVAFPPAGVPNLADALYFVIKVASPQWMDILNQGEIALYWEGAPKDVHLEVVMQRNA